MAERLTWSYSATVRCMSANKVSESCCVSCAVDSGSILLHE